MISLFYQIHGYRSGHQLISNNIRLNRIDQDTIDRLSDISGPLKPGEVFSPYFTCYPLPSKEYFVIARTWQDLTVPRAGCVVTKSLIIPMKQWELRINIAGIFQVLFNSSGDKDDSFNTIVSEYSFVPAVVNSPINELVESLFLENRQPILLFDCFEAENITIRLYSIFWVSIKKLFQFAHFHCRKEVSKEDLLICYSLHHRSNRSFLMACEKN